MSGLPACPRCLLFARSSRRPLIKYHFSEESASSTGPYVAAENNNQGRIITPGRGTAHDNVLALSPSFSLSFFFIFISLSLSLCLPFPPTHPPTLSLFLSLSASYAAVRDISSDKLRIAVCDNYRDRSRNRMRDMDAGRDKTVERHDRAIFRGKANIRERKN